MRHPPFQCSSPLGRSGAKKPFLEKLLQPLGKLFFYSLPAADFWVVRGHVVGGMASLHYTFLSGVGVWDANYAPSPLQVSRYASAWNVRPRGRAESRWVSGNLCSADRVVLYIFHFEEGFGI